MLAAVTATAPEDDLLVDASTHQPVSPEANAVDKVGVNVPRHPLGHMLEEGLKGVRMLRVDLGGGNDARHRLRP